MGFFKSLKGKIHGEEERDDLNPQQQQYQSPEVSYDDKTTKSEKQQVFGTGGHEGSSSATDQQHEKYTPPSGPPPSQSQYYQRQTEEMNGLEDTNNPPPYQSWLSVPDNSQLPPPPGIHSEFSPTNNASTDAAEAGHDWCDRNPIYMPARPNNAIHAVTNIKGDITLQTPPYFKGKLKKEGSGHQYFKSSPFSPTSTSSASTTVVTSLGRAHQPTAIYVISSPPRADDAAFLTTLPLYFAARDNPLLAAGTTQQAPSYDSQHSQRPQSQSKTISFAVRFISLSDPSAVIGVGFASKPYPPFRQPGWHRGSLAVHADDGRRYINDPYGGVEFVRPFRQGDLIVVSMVFYPEWSPIANSIGQQQQQQQQELEVSNLPKCRTRVEFERNGVWEGGWDVHEERDAERSSGIQGLQGEGDLYAAVGVCGDCRVEVLFWPQG